MTYAVYGRRSHKLNMKQTQTQAWSLAAEEVVEYSQARGKAAAVIRENGEVAACSLARERRRQQSLALGPCRAGTRQRENTETVAKQPSAGLAPR